MAGRRVASGRAVERVRLLCREHEDERSLRMAVLDELRRTAGFDVFVWLLTDPETQVGSAPLANAPSVGDLPRLIRAKYLTTMNRWTTLRGPVATLVDATLGDRAQSLMWRDVLSGYGVDDVASMVFRDQHGCWGWLDLWRIGGAPFSEADQAYLGAVAPPITEALRRCQARTFDHVTDPPERAGPVVLVLSPSLEVKAQTSETDAYLRTLVPPADDRRPIPAGAYNVAAQLLALEEGVDANPPSARVHLAHGVWMTLRAARAGTVGRPDERDVAVTIEPASPTERRDLYVKAHALTARETEIVQQLTRGADTKTIAAELFLSEHTVQDHLKSVFAKTGARNRRTLLSRVTGG